MLFRDKTIEIADCEADDESEDETAYLLRDPANRQRLMDAIENVRQGRVLLVDFDTDATARNAHPTRLEAQLAKGEKLGTVIREKLAGVVVDE